MVHYGRKELEPGPDEGQGDDGDDHPGGAPSAESDDDRVPALIY
jgi:hypothetical protein